MHRINFDGFPDDEKRAILAIREVLTLQDPSRIDDHLDAILCAPDGPMDSQYFAEPATIGLIAYKSDGLQALYRFATKSERRGKIADAVVALACVALQRADIAISFVEPSKAYLESEVLRELKRKISAHCHDIEMSLEAKRLISKFLHFTISEPTHRVQLFDLMSLISLHFAKIELSSADNLFIELLAKSTLNITDEICDEFADIIDQDLAENVYQDFLRRYPALLDPLASSIVDRQYLAEMWKTDFVIRRLDNEYIFVEIEKPRDKLFSDYPHPTSALSHAIGQVMNWFIWVEDNVAYAQSHGFPEIHLPKGIIVIGRKKDMREQQIRMLRAMNDLLHPRVTIITYDEVIASSRNVVRNLTSR